MLIAIAFVVGVIFGIAYGVKRTWPAIEYGRKLATALEVNGLTIAFRSAFNDGFEIADASIRTTGQRDPIVTAIEIVLRKTAKQQPVEARDVDHTADRAR